MREYVYLFELDSVRKTDEEIIAGQKALYSEIVNNGNIVVLTYNQLVDSRGFFSLLKDSEYQKYFIRLFENGAIRISQYGDIRSLSQYLINSVESEKQFIYSALPVKSSQRRLLSLIKRSLLYSDLSEIFEYSTGTNRSEKELIELFEELVDDETKSPENSEGTQKKKKILKQSSLFDEEAVNHSKESVVQEMRNILQKLYWLLSTVLRLSALHDIYISPKAPEEYKKLKMQNIITFVTEFENPQDPLWDKAIHIIKNLSCYQNGNNDRSVYLHKIKQKFKEDASKCKTPYQYAEAIINICYNYACELSICNVTKHYDVNELSENFSGEKTTFRSDFLNRLNQDWHDGNLADEKYLLDETMYFKEFEQLKALPKFKIATRYTGYVSYKTTAENESIIYRYEYNFNKKVQHHKKEIHASIRKHLLLAIICLFLAFAIDRCLDLFQDQLQIYMTAFSTTKKLALLPCIKWIHIPAGLKSVADQALEWLLLLIVSEVVTSGLAHVCPVLSSLSDALGDIGNLIKDAIDISFAKPAIYNNNCMADIAAGEKRNKSVPISLVLSPELKKYIKYQKNGTHADLFKNSSIYPIADVNDESITKNLMQLEELYGYKFGVVYQSNFNTLIVDPIKSSNSEAPKKFFPYERIVSPNGKNGVVMIPKYKNNFLLLNQYRHAPRKMQYSFPRGFSEDNSTSSENAARELKEEIGATIVNEPILLGNVISDSGLTGNRVDVYLVEIESFQQNQLIHEGIKQIIEIPVNKMDDWIRQGKIDDGFSLSAYALYQSHIK